MDIIFCSRVENLQLPKCTAPKGEKQNYGSHLISTAFFCSLIRVFPASNFTILEQKGVRCSQSVSGEKKGSEVTGSWSVGLHLRVLFFFFEPSTIKRVQMWAFVI